MRIFQLMVALVVCGWPLHATAAADEPPVKPVEAPGENIYIDGTLKPARTRVPNASSPAGALSPDPFAGGAHLPDRSSRYRPRPPRDWSSIARPAGKYQRLIDYVLTPLSAPADESRDAPFGVPEERPAELPVEDPAGPDVGTPAGRITEPVRAPGAMTEEELRAEFLRLSVRLAVVSADSQTTVEAGRLQERLDRVAAELRRRPPPPAAPSIRVPLRQKGEGSETDQMLRRLAEQRAALPVKDQASFANTWARLLGVAPVEIVLGREIGKFDRAVMQFNNISRHYEKPLDELPDEVVYKYDPSNPVHDGFYLRGNELEWEPHGLLGRVFGDGSRGLEKIARQFESGGDEAKAWARRQDVPANQLVMDGQGRAGRKIDLERERNTSQLVRGGMALKSGTGWIGYWLADLMDRSYEERIRWAETAANFGNLAYARPFMPQRPLASSPGAPRPSIRRPVEKPAAAASPTPRTSGAPRGGGKPPSRNGALPLDDIIRSLDGKTETGGFRFDGPGVRLPVRRSGEPVRVLEVAAGKGKTNLGLPPDGTVRTRRTDAVPRANVERLDATRPVPAEYVGKFDAIVINNPYGFTPNIAALGKALRPGGRIIVQGRAAVAPDQKGGFNATFQKLLDAPPPPGFRRITDLPPAPATSAGPRPGILGGAGPFPPGVTRPVPPREGSFQRTSGDREVVPNARIVFEKEVPAK